MVNFNFLDKAIEFFSPRRARQRAQERAALEYLKSRSYSAADRGRRTDGWNVRPDHGPNSDLARSLPVMRERARELVRNNPWAASIISEIVANVVHYGIIASFSREGDRQEDIGDVPDIWLQWAETTQCDASRRKDFYDIQRLVAQTWAETGECFVRRVWRSDWKPGEIPFALQVLEPDFIDQSRDGRDNVKLGIKFDSSGVVLGYYVHTCHPSESKFSRESQFVDAADMIHVFCEARPGQIRGIPLLAPSILRIYDLDVFEQAELQKQEVAAMFAGFRKKTESYSGRDNGYGDDQKKDGTINDMIQPGAIELLGPDEDIVFANPPQRSGYSEYVKQNLLAIAASSGPTYEGMTGDYGGVTFLNGRMGQLRFHRKVDQWQYLMFIPQFCQGSANWFREGALLAGYDLSRLAIEWQPPIKQMVDPSREVPAERESVRMGTKTQFDLIRERGNDPIKFLKNRKREQDLLDQYGLVFTTDVRKVSGAGQLQGGASSGNGDEEEKEGSKKDDDAEESDEK